MKATNFSVHSLLSASAVALALMAQSVYATPFTITSTLTGDPRPANPDNLFVYVTITGDTDSAVVTWLVDINSPLHSGVKLDAFYFNMAGSASDYSFSGYSPATWSITTPGTNAAGSGGADFMFVADSSNPATDVTNAVSLSFTMTNLTGDFLVTDFTGATPSSTAAGSGQLGAHLQSLTQGTGNTTDSGFAVGSYVVDDGGGPNVVPEPGAMLLMGAGLLGLGMARRRKTA